MESTTLLLIYRNVLDIQTGKILEHTELFSRRDTCWNCSLKIHVVILTSHKDLRVQPITPMAHHQVEVASMLIHSCFLCSS